LNRTLAKVIQALVILAMPIFLLLTAGRLVINTWYLGYEYGKPDFPLDDYGFTQAQRVELATGSIRFLQSSDPAEVAIKILADQQLPGFGRPLFTNSELSHMMDVKRFTDILWRVQTIAGLIAIGGLILLLAIKGTRREGYRALFWSGVFTTGLLLFLTFFVLVSWQMFFVTFHELFFPPGTWTFDFSSSLIRLYPDQFWFDAGTLITVGTLLVGIGITAAGYVLSRRTARPA
jgi:integral membrane protein (TIGR01906 family)